ncbi:MAG: SDR family oxidoreductase [Rhodothermales bacterium]|nr:SDR family oxidoreductase [Rhodothermales bacterium]
MESLNEQVAVVTGASSGIGEATARKLAAAGMTVVLAARREERLKQLQQEIEEQEGRALVVPTDVTDREAAQRLVDQTLEEYGRLDVLVNNAGVMPLSFVDKVKLDEWEWMVDVNVKGVLFCTAAALPAMLEAGRGHLVNISSVAGRRVFPGGAVYCATKFAVRAFSEGLRRELAPKHGIRVTNVEPGAVTTELPETITDEDIQRTMEKMQAMTFLEPEDIAEAVHFAVVAPPRMDVAEVLVMPTDQGS